MPLINQNIRVLRKKMGFTQEKFAEVLGVKRSLIGAYEESRAIPPAENLNKLAELFGVSLDQLLNYSFERDSIGKLNELFPDDLKHLQAYNINRKDLKGFENSSFSGDKANATFNKIDLFSSLKENQQASNSIENSKIRYINRQLFDLYLKNNLNQDFFFDLPCLSLPFLPKGYLRAFDAPSDFPMNDSILIVERVDNFELLKEGENHLIISKNLGFLYRRVYNQLNIKGVFLLSSDKSGIASSEISKEDVIEIWVCKSFIGKNMPPSTVPFESLLEKVSALNSEIQNIIKRQSMR
jgi:transcriptional regulator with XRE-family HTH domain